MRLSKAEVLMLKRNIRDGETQVQVLREDVEKYERLLASARSRSAGLKCDWEKSVDETEALRVEVLRKDVTLLHLADEFRKLASRSKDFAEMNAEISRVGKYVKAALSLIESESSIGKFCAECGKPRLA